MNIGEKVMIWGGPHHLRHGTVVDFEANVKAVQLDVSSTHALIAFHSKSGKLLRRCDGEGRPAVDLVVIGRLAVFSA